MDCYPQSTNKRRSLEFDISYFNLWLLVSSLFTAVGGVVSLYGPNGSDDCRVGVEIAAIILQGIAVIFCLIAITSAAWNFNYETNIKNSSVKKQKRDSKLRRDKVKNTHVIQALILIVVNIVSLIMVVIILVTKGCNEFIFNTVYNIFGIAGSFIINLITLIKLKKNKPQTKTFSSNQQLPRNFIAHYHRPLGHRMRANRFLLRPHPNPRIIR